MSKSVFEEVGGKSSEAAPAPAAGREVAARDRRRIRIWLLILALMTATQILAGGLTRLTDSGLSITEWRPVTGALPPISTEAWSSEFEKYKTTTEYQQQNHQMTLEEFKFIYWWEWGHRQWGRLIGLVFFIPFLFFLATKAIPTGWTGRILFVGALGATQGAIGWWMVSSGLVGRLDVSQHRLATHLGIAFVIMGLLLWHALSLKREEWALLQARRRREEGIRLFALALVGTAFLQIIMGAYVAGMDAGGAFPEWPTMEGGFYPAETPFHPFEEPGAAHFVHRMLGYLVALVAVGFWWRTRGSGARTTRLWGKIALGGVLFQVLIGIGAVLHAAPLSWSALHLLTAVLMFSVLIHAAHQTAYPKEEKLAA